MKLEMPFHKTAHVDVIKTIAKGLHDSGKGGIYIELGVQRGNCFNIVAPFFKRAHAVDISEESYGKIKKNKNLCWFHGETDDFFKQYDDNKADLIFIDADHHHESSVKDFINSLKIIKDGGIILLHDTYPPSEEFTSISYCGDTYKTAEYIKDNYNFETVTLPFYMGVTIVRITNKQLMWR